MYAFISGFSNVNIPTDPLSTKVWPAKEGIQKDSA